MDTLTLWLRENSIRFLRFTIALVVFWIGALKFLDPSPVVGLLDASLSFLASAGFVYVLGAFEVTVAVLLATGRGLRVVPLLLAGMFSGTLLIFLIAPGVSYGDAGFPALSLAGEFLIKDAVLLAATLTIYAAQPVARQGLAATPETAGSGQAAA